MYAWGIVLIPLSHPDSSKCDATLFMTFLGLSIMFAAPSAGCCVRAYRLTGRMLVHMAAVFGSDTHWSVLLHLPTQVQPCIRPFLAQRFIVRHVSGLAS